jgi:hypothetical protein
VESTIMALRPPVSATSGAKGSRCAGHGAVDALGRGGGAGEDDARDAGVGGDGGADDGAGAGEELERGAGDAGLVQELHRAVGDQRRRLGGFGEDGVAGGERAGDLAGEDGEREVPGRDAGDGAARGASAVAKEA